MEYSQKVKDLEAEYQQLQKEYKSAERKLKQKGKQLIALKK